MTSTNTPMNNPASTRCRASEIRLRRSVRRTIAAVACAPTVPSTMTVMTSTTSRPASRSQSTSGAAATAANDREYRNPESVGTENAISVVMANTRPATSSDEPATT